MSETESNRRSRFRQRLTQRNALLMAGAFNAMSARIVEDTGFEAVYVTGAGVTNMGFALPDLSFVGLAEMAEQAVRIRDAVDLPMMVDVDTGFGNPINVRQTVRTMERTGADALQIEDQVLPKKCGHFSGKQVIPAEEMTNKIRAAVDARHDENLLVVARTDAAAVHGIEAAIERAHRYAEAGADLLFIEAVEDRDTIERLPALFEVPLVMNIVIGGKTPVSDQPELARLGYGITLYANAALQGAVCGMQNALGELKRRGRLDEDPNLVAPFSERQRLVRKPLFDELSSRYAEQGSD
ncbi:oxaloacetate decarboxylase [Salinisphaera sp. SPP-AMP-43]|uniref:isocitrate lyase/PEP mutase family protein n=1 Tax=Salinisphaera sp. SPP-AMP-43 TaxID=3121288 RepID=UPI003C6DF2D0